ncbi:MAG TPA: hypothetical protein VGQ76_15555 [Thermoanaerobaculia bacterium]|nr:hypothetical protein [Thermoanaerobaculia bacterium]
MTPVVNGFVNSAINVPRDRLLHAFGFMMGEDSRFFFARSHDLFTDDWRGILMFALGTVVVYFPVAVFAALLKFDDEDLRADLDLPPRLRRALILLLVVAGAGVYAFRWQEYDDDYWGRVRLVWRWGRAAEIRMDRNRDGIVDLRLRYDRPSTVFYHNPPDEYWEDRDFNGRDDMHVRYAGMIVDVVRLDEDEDGVFERVLRGGAAIAYRAANAPFSPIHPQRRAR